MKDAPAVEEAISSFFLVLRLSFLQRRSWQVALPAEKRRPATSQHSTRRLKTEIRIWVPAVLCPKLVKAIQFCPFFGPAVSSPDFTAIVNRVNCLDAEAKVEAIEKMDQKDQHHRSAKHCMDSSLLRWLTHSDTQSCLCHCCGDTSMWHVAIRTEISRL